MNGCNLIAYEVGTMAVGRRAAGVFLRGLLVESDDKDLIKDEDDDIAP